MMVFCTIFCVQTDLLAQSISQTKLKTEQSGLKRRKYFEKQRKRKSKGNIKGKSKLLQKVYYKKKSNQIKYAGTFWVDPKPKDFTAIKERVEKRPSRKSLKAHKSRKSYFRASSNQRHKSYGGEVVLKRNVKLDYKYASKVNIRSKGKNKIKPLKKNYRKTSRQNQRHSGNIFLQPEAKKKDFNEIKARVEKRPGRSMAKQLNQKKSRATANASLTQTYRGEINAKGRNAKKQSYKYGSKVNQKLSGNLKARSIKSAENQRKYNSASSARFNGEVVLPSRNNKRLRHAYMSKESQKYKGKVKRPAKSPGPKYTAMWKGNLKAQNRRGKKQWAKFESKKQSQYAGVLNRKKNLSIAKAPFTKYYRGDVTVKAQQGKKQYYKYGSKTMQKSAGNLRARSVKSAEKQRKYNSGSLARFNGEIVLPARNNKRLRYEYMSRASQKHKGDIKRPSKTLGSQYTAKWSGDVISKRKKGEKRRKQYESKRQTQYAGRLKAKARKSEYGSNSQLTQNVGGIKMYSQNLTNRYKRKDSRTSAKLSANILTRSEKSRSQKLQSKSLNLTQHQGNLKSKKQKYRSQEIEGKSLNHTQYEGNLRRYSRNKQNVAPGVGTTYAGNIRAISKKSRIQGLRNKSMSFTGVEGNIKVVSKKKQDKFMLKDSKFTGNDGGDVVVLSPKYKRQALEGKSLNMSEYRGDLKIKNQGKAANRQPRTNLEMAAYQGDIIIMARERKKLEYEYRSKVQHNYKGDVNQKKYVKWADGRKTRSNAMANFQGNLIAPRVNKKERQYEYMSITAQNYSGNQRIKKHYARDNYYRNISERNLQIIGNYQVKTGLFKDIEQQITSARVHNYQGGPKMSLFTRMWLSLFDNSGKLEKIDDKTKKPDYDSREYNIWY